MSVWLSPEGLELTLHFGPSQIPLSQEALGQETLLGVQSQEMPGSKPTVATTAAKQQGSHRVKAACGLSGVIARMSKGQNVGSSSGSDVVTTCLPQLAQGEP